MHLYFVELTDCHSKQNEVYLTIYEISVKSRFTRQACLPVGIRLYCTPRYEHAACGGAKHGTIRG